MVSDVVKPDAVLPPLVFIDEGGEVGHFFASVDEMFTYLEWPDQFEGQPAQCFDSSGREFAVAVDSEGEPAIRARGDADRARLESLLRPVAREHPVRYGLLDADVELDVLLRALWPRMSYYKGRFPAG